MQNIFRHGDKSQADPMTASDPSAAPLPHANNADKKLSDGSGVGLCIQEALPIGKRAADTAGEQMAVNTPAP